MQDSTKETPVEQDKPTNRRGFRSMSPDKLREVCSRGGKAAHALGVAHKWTPEEAAEAGRRGGARSKRPRKLESA